MNYFTEVRPTSSRLNAYRNTDPIESAKNWRSSVEPPPDSFKRSHPSMPTQNNSRPQVRFGLLALPEAEKEYSQHRDSHLLQTGEQIFLFLKKHGFLVNASMEGLSPNFFREMFDPQNRSYWVGTGVVIEKTGEVSEETVSLVGMARYAASSRLINQYFGYDNLTWTIGDADAKNVCPESQHDDIDRVTSFQLRIIQNLINRTGLTNRWRVLRSSELPTLFNMLKDKPGFDNSYDPETLKAQIDTILEEDCGEYFNLPTILAMPDGEEKDKLLAEAGEKKKYVRDQSWDTVSAKRLENAAGRLGWAVEDTLAATKGKWDERTFDEIYRIVCQKLKEKFGVKIDDDFSFIYTRAETFPGKPNACPYSVSQNDIKHRILMTDSEEEIRGKIALYVRAANSPDKFIVDDEGKKIYRREAVNTLKQVQETIWLFKKAFSSAFPPGLERIPDTPEELELMYFNPFNGGQFDIDQDRIVAGLMQIQEIFMVPAPATVPVRPAMASDVDVEVVVENGDPTSLEVRGIAWRSEGTPGMGDVGRYAMGGGPPLWATDKPPSSRQKELGDIIVVEGLEAYMERLKGYLRDWDSLQDIEKQVETTAQKMTAAKTGITSYKTSLRRARAAVEKIEESGEAQTGELELARQRVERLEADSDPVLSKAIENVRVARAGLVQVKARMNGFRGDILDEPVADIADMKSAEKEADLLRNEIWQIKDEMGKLKTDVEFGIIGDCTPYVEALHYRGKRGLMQGFQDLGLKRVHQYFTSPKEAAGMQLEAVSFQRLVQRWDTLSAQAELGEWPEAALAAEQEAIQDEMIARCPNYIPSLLARGKGREHRIRLDALQKRGMTEVLSFYQEKLALPDHVQVKVDKFYELMEAWRQSNPIGSYEQAMANIQKQEEIERAILENGFEFLPFLPQGLQANLSRILKIRNMQAAFQESRFYLTRPIDIERQTLYFHRLMEIWRDVNPRYSTPPAPTSPQSELKEQIKALIEDSMMKHCRAYVGSLPESKQQRVLSILRKQGLTKARDFYMAQLAELTYA